MRTPPVILTASLAACPAASTSFGALPVPAELESFMLAAASTASPKPTSSAIPMSVAMVEAMMGKGIWTQKLGSPIIMLAIREATVGEVGGEEAPGASSATVAGAAACACAIILVESKLLEMAIPAPAG